MGTSLGFHLNQGGGKEMFNRSLKLISAFCCDTILLFLLFIIVIPIADEFKPSTVATKYNWL